ncbi:TLC domain-containing protein 3A-like [Anneissia japonica]|uniref:TLC domain-containing protein 3A-like n=1 Tax=Anneissia japonica TaxID=1529436 RepID=UPI0014256AD6|nr:TLC domain-containing protein 3A-like [Anneissia japonica]
MLLNLFISSLVLFFLLFGLFCNILRPSTKKFENSEGVTTEVANRLVCILQGIAASVVGLTTVVFCNLDVIHDRWWLAEPYSVINTAYFTYDVYAMFIVYRHSKYEILRLPYWTAVGKFLNARGVFVAHHVLTILIGPPVILYFRKGLGDFFLGCYLLSETTTPFFNARVLLKKIQKDNTRLYVLINILLFFVFVCFRLLIFPFMYYSYAQYKQISMYQAFSSIPWHCNLGNFGFLLLQLGWFYMLMRIGMKMVKSRLKSKQVESMQHSVYSSAINGYDTYHSD